MKKPNVVRRFSSGWIPVDGGKASMPDLKFFRIDSQTGKEISNDEVHGVRNEEKLGGLSRRTD